MKSSWAQVPKVGLFLVQMVTEIMFLPNSCLAYRKIPLMLLVYYCKMFSLFCWKCGAKQQKINVNPHFFCAQLQAGGTVLISSDFVTLLETHISRGEDQVFLLLFFSFIQLSSHSPPFPLGCQALAGQVEQAQMTAQQALAGMYAGNFSLPKDFSSWYLFQSAKEMQCINESTCRASLALSPDLTKLLHCCDSREFLVPGPC